MCSLCGMIGGRGHWTESTSHPEAFLRAEASTRGRERQQRTRLVNRVLAAYGLTVSDFSGSGYMLRSHTGRSAMIDNLSELWAEAERLTGRDCDPLDPGLVSVLSGETV